MLALALLAALAALASVAMASPSPRYRPNRRQVEPDLETRETEVEDKRTRDDKTLIKSIVKKIVAKNPEGKYTWRVLLVAEG